MSRAVLEHSADAVHERVRGAVSVFLARLGKKLHLTAYGLVVNEFLRVYCGLHVVSLHFRLDGAGIPDFNRGSIERRVRSRFCPVDCVSDRGVSLCAQHHFGAMLFLVQTDLADDLEGCRGIIVSKEVIDGDFVGEIVEESFPVLCLRHAPLHFGEGCLTRIEHVFKVAVVLDVFCPEVGLDAQDVLSGILVHVFGIRLV